MSIDSRYNGGFKHGEADVTMIATVYVCVNVRWPVENHDANVTWLPSRNKDLLTYLLTYLLSTAIF